MAESLRAQLADARDWMFPRKCLRKKRWLSERVAKAVMKTRMESTRDRPQELYCYRCVECGGWHITKMKQN